MKKGLQKMPMRKPPRILCPLGVFLVFIVTSNSACLSPDGRLLILLGELNYQIINTLAGVYTT
jgi:hypothetical protein